MFSSLRKAKIVIEFLNARLGDYLELARLDLAAFRSETINSIVGLAVGAAAFLLLLCFVCVAILVTEWNTPNRILAAWIICLGWAVLTAACVAVAWKLTRKSSPFGNLGLEITRDLAAIRSAPKSVHARD
jgi:Putative Actinobacterial Holin-X, holin superfamily III